MYEMREVFDLQTLKEIVETRFKMVQSRIKEDKSINEILSSFKVSRPIYYKFYHRFLEYGKLGLHNLSRAPHKHGRKTPEDKEDILLQYYSKYPFFSSYEFTQLTGLNPRTIQRIKKRNNLKKAYLPKREKKLILEKLKKAILKEKREKKSKKEF